MIKTKIFCIGDAGGNIASSLLLKKFNIEDIFIFNTDSRAIENSILKNKFIIGKNICEGLGAGANPENGKKAFEEDIQLFDKLTTEDNLYIIISGLGGGTGTGVSPKVCNLLLEKKKKFIAIMSEPFTFEGLRRKEKANLAISEISKTTNQLILLSNDKLRKIFGNLSLNETFSRADNFFSDILQDLILNTESSIASNEILLDQYEISFKSILNIKDYIKSNFPIPFFNSKIIIPDTNKSLLNALTLDEKLIYTISPKKFEELIEYIYRISGFETQLTPYSKDNGADLLVWTPPPILGNRFLTIVQAKRYNNSNKVGASEIRDLIGTQMLFNADKAQIITTSDFTKQAKQNANKGKIDLLKFNELNQKIQNIIKL